MALSVETGGLRLAAPMVPQLSQANALAGLKPLSFTGGLQTPLSFQAPKAWNIASNHPEAITAGAASAAQSIMAGYKSKRELERDAKKLDFEEKRLEETKRHNERIEEAAFQRIDKVTPKGSKAAIDYSEDSGSTDYSSSGNSASSVVSRGTPVQKTAEEAPVQKTVEEAPAEPPAESMVISPESSTGIPSFARIFSPSSFSLGTKITNVQIGDVVAEPDQKVSLKDTAPPVAVARPQIQFNQPRRNLEAIAVPQSMQVAAPSPSKESPAAVEARREKGNVTPAERQGTLLAENEQVEKDERGIPVITAATANAVAKAARTPTPAPALAGAQPPQAAPAYSPPALRDQEAPMYGRVPTKKEQQAVHNSAQRAQDFVLDFNRKFANTPYSAKIVGEIEGSISKETGLPQWRVAYDFDKKFDAEKSEKRAKAEAADASLALQKKRVDNLTEQKLQSRAKSWEVEPIAKLMETRRDAMARFLVAADRALDPTKVSETSRPVVDQEMKDLFVTFATGRVPTEGQYHEINTAYRGLIPTIENKFKKYMTGQTLDEKDIKTIRSMMLETYNSSARNVNNALSIIKEDLIADHPEVPERKHPTLYAILRLPEQIEAESEAEKEKGRVLWDSGKRDEARIALAKHKSLIKELEKARKEGASNADKIREFEKGTFPGFHAWRFGGAAEIPANNSPL